MDVTLPNGTVIRGVPEGTNKYAIMEKAISSGLATPEDFGQQSANPAEGMSGVEKFRAGWGKAGVDLARGAGQMVGMVSRQDVANSRERDAPLMRSGAATAGNIGGAVANFLPTAFIPGANTVAGATAIGAGAGLLQPSVSTGETLKNTALGGVLGGGSVLGARAIGSLYQGGKSMLEPFLKGGQDRIAARALTQFAGGTDEAAKVLQSIAQNSPDTLPGVQPTTAELAQNAGLSQLERTLRNNPEVLSRMSDQLLGNRSAMIDAVESISTTPAQRAVDAGLRSDFASPLYDAAKRVKITSDDALETLLSRPSMKSAWQRAAQLAQERGETLVTGQDLPERVVNSAILNSGGKPFSTTLPSESEQYSGRAIQYLKMALRDLADSGPQNGMGAHEVSAVNNTLRSLNGWIEKNVPALRKADAMYSWASRPINQAEIAASLRDKLVPALADFGANTRLTPASYARALRNGDDTAAQVLGRSNASLKDIMSPQQMGTLEQVGRNLARRVNADELGKAIGSNTGQNIVGQNVLRQLLGPFGLPESTIQRAAASTIGQSVIGRPATFVASIGEDRVLKKLAEAALNPVEAQRLLQQGVKPEVLALLRYQQLFGPISSAAGLAATAD